MNGIDPPTLLKASNVLDKKTKMLNAAAVRLYTCASDQTSWQYSGAKGILFVTEPQDKIPMLVLVDYEGTGIICEHEIYPEIDFSVLTNFFGSFESSDCTVGINFADGTDVKGFAKAVNAFKGASSKSPATLSVKKTEEKKEDVPPSPGGGFFGKFKTLFGGGAKKEEKPVETTPRRPKISGPTDVKDGMHIGFQQGKGFTYTNLPDEWKKFFADAGVSEETFDNPKAAKKLLMTISTALSEDAPQQNEPPVKTPKSAPPPPPPSSRHSTRMLPPTPPTPPPAQSTGAAPPPPPPAPLAPPVQSQPSETGGAPPPPPPPPPPPGPAATAGAPPPPPPPPPPPGPPAPMAGGPPPSSEPSDTGNAPPARRNGGGGLLSEIAGFDKNKLSSAAARKTPSVMPALANMSAEKKEDLMALVKTSLQQMNFGDDSDSDDEW